MPKWNHLKRHMISKIYRLNRKKVIMHYGGLLKSDIANGPGCRVVLFVSGCNHNCKGCHNPETHDGTYGKPFTQTTHIELMEDLKYNYISGLTLTGGDPLYPDNRQTVYNIVYDVKHKYPDKSIWLYTGFTWESLMKEPEIVKSILQHIDVLVDGPFIESKKDLRLMFRGSSNQRIIDVQKSLIENKVILYMKEKDDETT